METHKLSRCQGIRANGAAVIRFCEAGTPTTATVILLLFINLVTALERYVLTFVPSQRIATD